MIHKHLFKITFILNNFYLKQSELTIVNKIDYTLALISFTFRMFFIPFSAEETIIKNKTYDYINKLLLIIHHQQIIEQ